METDQNHKQSASCFSQLEPTRKEGERSVKTAGKKDTTGNEGAAVICEVRYVVLKSMFDMHQSDLIRRILQLTENQNIGISTNSWRVVTRKVTAKMMEMLLEVDDKSANIIIANESYLNYKFSKARLRKVTGGAFTAKRGNSVAQPSNSATCERLPLNGKGRQNPTAKAPEKPIPKKARKQQPIASSTNAAPGTGRCTTTGTKTQPPGSSNSQKTLNGIEGKPANQRSRVLRSVSEDLGPSNIGVTAVGDRQPTPESTGSRAKDGTVPGQ